MPTQQNRKYVYATVTQAEHEIVTARAIAAGQSMSEFVREAVNARLFDENEDGPLLTQTFIERRPSRTHNGVESKGQTAE